MLKKKVNFPLQAIFYDFSSAAVVVVASNNLPTLQLARENAPNRPILRQANSAHDFRKLQFCKNGMIA
jgi:hypothetical protein